MLKLRLLESNIRLKKRLPLQFKGLLLFLLMSRLGGLLLTGLVCCELLLYHGQPTKKFKQNTRNITFCFLRLVQGLLKGKLFKLTLVNLFGFLKFKQTNLGN